MKNKLQTGSKYLQIVYLTKYSYLKSIKSSPKWIEENNPNRT